MAGSRSGRWLPLALLAGSVAVGGLIGVAYHRLTAPSPGVPSAVAVVTVPPPQELLSITPAPAVPTPATPLSTVLRLTAVACPDEAGMPGPAPRCAVLRVPSDRLRPNGPPVDLFVLTLPALAPTPAADPVVVLSGGPGQGGSDDLHGAVAIFGAMRERRDVILVDQRGTGRSRPSLHCPALDPLRFWYGGVTAEDATACLSPLRREGFWLESFDTGESASDLRDLRVALGVERWNVVATSYGGILAQALLRVDGEAVRSLVLNSPAMPDATWLDFDRLTAIRETYRRLFADCAAQPACAHAFPNLDGTVERIAAGLERQPLETRLRAPSSGREAAWRFTWPMVASTLSFRLGSGGGMAALPAQLDRLDRMVAGRQPADERTLAALLMPDLFWNVSDTLAYGLNLTIGCRENRPRIDAADARRAAQGLRPYVMADTVETDYDTACPALSLAPVESGFYRPVVSEVPTLILTGVYDTLTVPARAEALKNTLRRAVVLPFRGVGHDVLGASLCARTLAARHVDLLEVGNAGDCPERFLPPVFVTVLPPLATRP
ncbi:alpha/beta fold hydrolase [Azospirillum doebereinerae]|uniref:alpha/beta fold hydrolase n=1 Tax=Azospirillum doebereinerae TaxID=92933 RepID=UPI001EE512DD|nr:alpha/beta fold hydrolase [Azospirillum doebereinerae]MCG5240452.1 alpha/beta fold hydrolase [Azospirillum doebereinerae]